MQEEQASNDVRRLVVFKIAKTKMTPRMVSMRCKLMRKKLMIHRRPLQLVTICMAAGEYL